MTPSIPIISTINPIIVWNPPSHLASFSRCFPNAGIAGRIPAANIRPANIVTSAHGKLQ